MPQQSGDLRRPRFGVVQVFECVVIALIVYAGTKVLPPDLLTYAILAALALVLVLLVVRQVMTPTVRSHYGHRARAARAATTGELADAPERIAPDRCWQCGKKVRPDAAVCGWCGATRYRPPVPTVHIPDISEEHERPTGRYALQPQPWQHQQGWTPSYPTSNPSNPSMSGPRRLWPFTDAADEDATLAPPER